MARSARTAEASRLMRASSSGSGVTVFCRHAVDALDVIAALLDGETIFFARAVGSVTVSTAFGRVAAKAEDEASLGRDENGPAVKRGQFAPGTVVPRTKPPGGICRRARPRGRWRRPGKVRGRERDW